MPFEALDNDDDDDNNDKNDETFIIQMAPSACAAEVKNPMSRIASSSASTFGNYDQPRYDD